MSLISSVSQFRLPILQVPNSHMWLATSVLGSVSVWDGGERERLELYTRGWLPFFLSHCPRSWPFLDIVCVMPWESLIQYLLRVGWSRNGHIFQSVRLNQTSRMTVAWVPPEVRAKTRMTPNSRTSSFTPGRSWVTRTPITASANAPSSVLFFLGVSVE